MTLPGGLRARMVGFVGVLLILSAALLGITFYRQSRALLEAELANRGGSLARGLAFQAAYGVLTKDEVALGEIADWALTQPNVEHIRILDASGLPLLFRQRAAVAGRDAGNPEPSRTYTAPVLSRQESGGAGEDDLLAIPLGSRPAAGSSVGLVEVALSTHDLDHQIGRQAAVSALLVAGILISGGGILFFFLRVVVRPIHRLAEDTIRIAAGDFSLRAHAVGRDEIGQLAESFNIMVESLLRSRHEIEAHEAVLEQRVLDRTAALRQANDELRQAQGQLLQAEKLSAVGRLVSGVAHELNNPLTSVMGYAELLKASPQIPEEQRQRIAVIHAEAERCRRIVQDLLTFSRSRRITRQSVDLNQVVAGTLRLQEQALRTAGVRARAALDPEPLLVLGDPHMLQQVLVNLITNARDALATRPESDSLMIRTMANGGEAQILVSDNGPGIPGDVIGRIFEPFFTTKEVGKGTGLGLSLCYGIIEEHGGRIQAFNDPEGGASFLISLPRAAATVWSRFEAVPGRPAGPETSAMEAAQTAGSPTRLRILIVDDDPQIPELIEEALRPSGHVIVKVGNGRKALESLESQRFDLILSDMRMPGLDGAGLHSEISRRCPEMLPRLVMVTGDQANDETRAFLTRSGVRFLYKPFSLLDLMRVVEGVMPRAA